MAVASSPKAFFKARLEILRKLGLGLFECNGWDIISASKSFGSR